MQQTKSIPIIEEFLQLWKGKAKIYYKGIIKEMQRLSEEQGESINKYNNRFSLEKEEREKIILDHDIKWKAYSKFQHENFKIYSIMYPKPDREKKLENFLTKEVDRKRLNLISRVEKKIGQIKDASNLSISSNAEINGLIIGKIGRVEIETIYAGGHNIQCLHYRVLIKEIK